MLSAVAGSWQREAAELALADQIESVRVYRRTATGTGDLDATVSLDREFRLVYVRCHFSGPAGRSALDISLDSAAGAAYDAKLFSVRVAGVGADLNLRLWSSETALPSAWSFQQGDALRLKWTNPDPGNVTWGLEVGLAPAS